MTNQNHVKVSYHAREEYDNSDQIKPTKIIHRPNTKKLLLEQRRPDQIKHLYIYADKEKGLTTSQSRYVGGVDIPAMIFLFIGDKLSLLP